ncbi:MAG: hypothetical protein UY48_C0003G0014 [Candidatus Gottesmanbacteria bacterium GW2011_GWB1_49_7]|uniref:Uncharacterized protein n=1 Tax=Candidatus Gottesmanbacteria bacterium GW2011_GWB1_49_7 TaxID=1618448 RepID=A0A0G1YE15_9BACT|nr:MAG: hypothetical protein UY48_C0003G0014 [Candidatus Gottesmanbacteria bacterium GW2011_GWB1_49_7]
MLCLKSAQVGQDLPSFVIPVPSELYDSIVGRRSFFIGVLRDIAKHCGETVFPMIFECPKGCRAVIESPDSIPIDDVKCLHGIFIRFDPLEG